jgi:hypothetical protein
MESRSRAEAERLIEEQRRTHGAPQDVERRTDAAGREAKTSIPGGGTGDGPLLDPGIPGTGSILGSSDDALLPDPDAGGIGQRGPAGYAQRGGMEGPDESNIRKSQMWTPNDDMAGEGWTLPETRDEGWVLPQEPGLEERLKREDPMPEAGDKAGETK